jgi:hypothetical protein
MGEGSVGMGCSSVSYFVLIKEMARVRPYGSQEFSIIFLGQ